MAKKNEARQLFGRFIQNMRELSNLTQEQASAKIGWGSAQFLSNIERGVARCPMEKLPYVARAIGIGRNELYEAWERVMIAERREKWRKLNARSR